LHRQFMWSTTHKGLKHTKELWNIIW